MKEPAKTQQVNFMRILIKLGLNKNEVCGITSLLKTEDMLMDALDRLGKKNFKVTPQETMNICGQVIKENL